MKNNDHCVEHKKPGRKPVNIQFDLKVEYVPVLEDQEGAYRTGIQLLLQLLHEERRLYEQELKSQNEDK